MACRRRAPAAWPPKRSARIERLREEQPSPRNRGAPRSAMPSAWSAPSRRNCRKPPAAPRPGTLRCANHYIRAARLRSAVRARAGRQRAASAPQVPEVTSHPGDGRGRRREESVASGPRPSTTEHPMARLSLGGDGENAQRAAAPAGRAQPDERDFEIEGKTGTPASASCSGWPAASSRQRRSTGRSRVYAAGPGSARYAAICAGSRPQLLPRRAAGRGLPPPASAAAPFTSTSRLHHGEAGSPRPRPATERAAAPAAVVAMTTGATCSRSAAGSRCSARTRSASSQVSASQPWRSRSEVVPASPCAHW